MAEALNGDEVVRLFLDGVSIRVIGKQFGVRGTRISDMLVVAGLRQAGDKGYRFRLRPEQEAEVARRYAAHERTSAIATSFNIPVSTVRKIAARHGLTINPRGQQYRDFTDAEVAEMARMWHDGMPLARIAQSLHSHPTIVGRVLRREGHQPAARPASREAHPMWKGGRAIHGDGYVWVRVEADDPLAQMRSRAGYVLEHRLVMARALGRPLTPNETVHHINDDKTDNRLENLQLRQGRHGTGVVLVCLACGSHNIGVEPLAENSNP
jgi:hypothetical protein